MAIDSFRIHEKAMAMGLADPMTGFYNCRHFDRALDQETKRCRRYNRAFSLLFLDIDHFMRVHDTYGHGEDDIIKKAAELIRKNLRGLDGVGRVGGEEFAAYCQRPLPRT